MKKVDILLPIYNSYEETKSCIQSILTCSNAELYRLFLLDDKSSDARIEKLTKYYRDNYEHIHLNRNEQNLGFPQNVNKGFALSTEDVIVLNSDTIVTGGWIEKLQAAAYRKEAIAAVNPMSNYGIISGLPTNNSEINSFFNFEELHTLFEKDKEEDCVFSPLLIGFCMYMKREALQLIGDFDAKTFKRGYGEETDWCMRARQGGLKLVVAKNVYVHHIGGVSFGAEKEVLRKNSKQILLERFPEIDLELKHFIRANYFKQMRYKMMRQLNIFTKDVPFNVRLKWFRHLLLNKL
ncbi:glycosyltransferase family 2 protein [Bacillus sp. 03113]|uniref:glycosyltransferase family 2 protein n=1 Tax=Bacillus sp. 03113 TaxID=2578211 RepID=UPI001144469C|nr:glycosyltransferase family 2 protein [Bacillus sp. 03113]